MTDTTIAPTPDTAGSPNPTIPRYEFVLLFDVRNGNPNGDPDAGNAPRLDPETGHGLVSDVCLKRKVRNFVTLAKRDTEGAADTGYEIYVQERAVLNDRHERAYEALDLNKKAKGKDLAAVIDQARDWMCGTFFDIRTFGAVMSTGVNAGQVRGPVQMTFSTSIDPIVALEQSITRMAVTKAEDIDKQRTMGRKEIVPYALYRCHGFVNPFLAGQTGFSADDLSLLWTALGQMFEHDRSAARGEMATQRLIAFEHASPLGSAPAHKLLKRVKVEPTQTQTPARSFDDYQVTIDTNGLPAGVTVHELV